MCLSFLLSVMVIHFLFYFGNEQSLVFFRFYLIVLSSSCVLSPDCPLCVSHVSLRFFHPVHFLLSSCCPDTCYISVSDRSGRRFLVWPSGVSCCWLTARMFTQIKVCEVLDPMLIKVLIRLQEFVLCKDADVWSAECDGTVTALFSVCI